MKRGTEACSDKGVFRKGSVRLSDRSGRKRLPIGVSDFPKAIRNFTYIDKSMLIADILDGDSDVMLYCRPRRFGKSLNLSMIQRFLEIPSPNDPAAADTADLFEGLAIWEAEDGRYREQHNAYPVVRLSFNNTKGLTWEETFGAIVQNIVAECGRHRYLLNSTMLSSDEKDAFRRLVGGSASDVELAASLTTLVDLLHRHHVAPTVVLVDEYDAPVLAGYTHGYYTEVVGFLKRWLTGALKDNPSLAFGVLTGVQRISKESIFSDLNNLTVNTSLSVASDERYGFTQQEVELLADYLGVSDGLDVACEWYDGYRFGSIDAYNPWSVLNYFSSQCVPDLYWGNTSGNGVLGDLVASAEGATLQKLYVLMEPDGVIDEPLDTGVIFPDVGVRPDALWSMLYLAGYLTTDDTSRPNSPDQVRPLRIPNKEVAQLYRSEIVSRFTGLAGSRDRLVELHNAIVTGNAATLIADLERILSENASYHDLTHEQAYHTLLLGLLFGMRNYRDPFSNREAGLGRFDIRLEPENPAQHPLVTIELKRTSFSSNEPSCLEELAREALDQITEKAYESGAQRGAAGTIRWGIAFSGKHVAALCER
ncbi:AAA family ATPase [Adlercreutzia sp. ZJ141]|uniref:AAA family ATPase n=1 Tax=Adlercreutzia sp. ZJ141 TaxID=2709406 RepID=UPI0013EA90CF|nr:AAA family ATPase [Adlercreutzia sp. ZJ141]